jgi:hypothetical protein
VRPEQKVNIMDSRHEEITAEMHRLRVAGERFWAQTDAKSCTVPELIDSTGSLSTPTFRPVVMFRAREDRAIYVGPALSPVADRSAGLIT